MCPFNVLALVQLAGAVVIAAVILFWFRRRTARRRALLAGLHARFGGAVTGGFFSSGYTGSYAGLALELAFVSGGDKDDTQLLVRLRKPSGFSLALRRRGPLSALSTLFSRLSEVKSGDTDWDGAFFAASDSASRAAALLGTPSFRGDASSLLSLGFASVSLDTARAEASRYVKDEAEELRPDRVEAAAALLLKLSEAAR